MEVEHKDTDKEYTKEHEPAVMARRNNRTRSSVG
jgi:hypothetical protein